MKKTALIGQKNESRTLKSSFDALESARRGMSRCQYSGAMSLYSPNAWRPQTDDLFAPPGAQWNRLSPRYVAVRRIEIVISWMAISAVVGIVAVLIAGNWLPFPHRFLVAGALIALVTVWQLWLFLRAKRWVDSWGWAERDNDLCITHGLLAKELAIVPFGRMQVVNVTAGPLMRWKGLATVKIVTAAVAQEGTIPGLTHEDAIALRDRLIERSDAQGAGL